MAAKAPAKTWKAREVRNLLHDYYAPSDEWRREWLTLHEMELPELNHEAGRRRIDFIAVNLWWGSRGFAVAGHEIKVTRADWLQELDLFGKSAETMRYCTSWHVVAPKGIVQEGELPDGWGLLEVVGKGTIRRNTHAELREAAFDQEFAWRLLHKAAKHARRELTERERQLRDEHDAEVEERVSQAAAAIERRAEKAEETLNHLRKVTGLNLGRWGGNISDSELAKAKMLARMLQQRDGVRRMLRNRLADLRDDVAKLEQVLGGDADDAGEEDF